MAADKNQKGLYAVFVVFFLSVSAVFILHSRAAAGENSPYIIGVVPQHPPVTMYKNWMPFLEQLMKETGEKIKLKVYETMSDFEKDYNKGVPDFLYANPTQSVQARQNQGYVPLVRNAKPISGILFVRKDSDIRSIKDLKGREVAFVGSKSI